MSDPSASRFSRLSIGLHWLMLLLVAGVYACIELRVLFERGSPPREALRSWHFMLGLTVLALVLLRIAVRLRNGRPPIVPALPAWQEAAARISHLLLYALMLGMPLLGWTVASLRGNEIVFFGLPVPPLFAENKDLGKALREWHETFGRIGYALIALHASAALYHHYLRRDNVLRRMLPRG